MIVFVHLKTSRGYKLAAPTTYFTLVGQINASLRHEFGARSCKARNTGAYARYRTEIGGYNAHSSIQERSPKSPTLPNFSTNAEGDIYV
jgi:hypothetical protein